jgi:hypothetical protein
LIDCVRHACGSQIALSGMPRRTVSYWIRKFKASMECGDVILIAGKSASE